MLRFGAGSVFAPKKFASVCERKEGRFRSLRCIRQDANVGPPRIRLGHDVHGLDLRCVGVRDRDVGSRNELAKQIVRVQVELRAAGQWPMRIDRAGGLIQERTRVLIAGLRWGPGQHCATLEHVVSGRGILRLCRRVPDQSADESCLCQGHGHGYVAAMRTSLATGRVRLQWLRPS